eukprot:m.128189 g.128189  ORF g.128189 m.128189 type:complete len:56 (-) comp9449_c2_seq9:843-1010(-)
MTIDQRIVVIIALSGYDMQPHEQEFLISNHTQNIANTHDESNNPLEEGSTVLKIM